MGGPAGALSCPEEGVPRAFDLAREPGALGRVQVQLPKRLLDVDDRGLDVGRLAQALQVERVEGHVDAAGQEDALRLLAPLTPLALQSRMILYLIVPSTRSFSRQQTLERIGSRPRYRVRASRESNSRT